MYSDWVLYLINVFFISRGHDDYKPKLGVRKEVLFFNTDRTLSRSATGGILNKQQI